MEPISYFDWEKSFKKGLKTRDLESMQIQFNGILRNLAFRSDIMKSAAILNSHIKILNYKISLGQIYCLIKENLEKETEVYIDFRKKILIHKCKELKTYNSLSKKLCSHIIKVLLTIMEESVQQGLNIIKILNREEFKFYF